MDLRTQIRLEPDPHLGRTCFGITALCASSSHKLWNSTKWILYFYRPSNTN